MEKVIDIADRIPTLREKRRRRSNLKFLVLILIFLLTLFLLLYFQSPYSKIEKIKISGAELVPAENYLQDSKLQTGDSMWGFKVKDVENKIKKLDWVKDVKVKRQLFRTVNIKVEEYKKVAYISKDNLFYPVLENGQIMKEKSVQEPTDAPVFINFEDGKMRKRLLRELTKLDSSILTLISEIHSNKDDSYGITLYMIDGFEVRADITTLAKKMNYYPSIVAQLEQSKDAEKGVIDIEVGTYYRPYSDEYSKKKITVKTSEKEKGEEESE